MKMQLRKRPTMEENESGDVYYMCVRGDGQLGGGAQTWFHTQQSGALPHVRRTHTKNLKRFQCAELLGTRGKSAVSESFFIQSKINTILLKTSFVLNSNQDLERRKMYLKYLKI